MSIRSGFVCIPTVAKFKLVLRVTGTTPVMPLSPAAANKTQKSNEETMPKLVKLSTASYLRLVVVMFAVAIVSVRPGCGGSSANSLSKIAVSPLEGSVGVGASQQLTATGTYSNGSTQDLTASAAWSSSSTSVATITSPGGLATGVAPG